MLVYGDGSRLASTRTELDGIAAALRQVAAMPPGIERHGELVSVFIATGALAQGIADAEFAARGCDARSLAQDAAMDGLVRLAEAIRRSWTTGFVTSPIPDAALKALARLPLPEHVELKRPEGYAFYALYPESYLEAASALAGVSPLRVVGIRSIGTGLAALVAAATAAPRPVSVRPTGDPFRRRVNLCEDLAAELAGDPAWRVAIADEGPGLSGSSFGAVADALAERGVSLTSGCISSRAMAAISAPRRAPVIASAGPRRRATTSISTRSCSAPPIPPIASRAGSPIWSVRLKRRSRTCPAAPGARAASERRRIGRPAMCSRSAASSCCGHAAGRGS